jgi:hypothetical protein
VEDFVVAPFDRRSALCFSGSRRWRIATRGLCTSTTSIRRHSGSGVGRAWSLLRNYVYYYKSLINIFLI